MTFRDVVAVTFIIFVMMCVVMMGALGLIMGLSGKVSHVDNIKGVVNHCYKIDSHDINEHGFLWLQNRIENRHVGTYCEVN